MPEHCDRVLAAADRSALLSSSSSSSISSSSVLPGGFNWKCIYCRARGWSERRRLCSLWRCGWGEGCRVWLQLSTTNSPTQSVSLLSMFFGGSLVYCSLTYSCLLTPLYLLGFSLRSLLSFLASCLSYSLSLIFRSWLGMYKVYLNANCASRLDRNYEVTIIICWILKSFFYLQYLVFK